MWLSRRPLLASKSNYTVGAFRDPEDLIAGVLGYIAGGLIAGVQHISERKEESESEGLSWVVSWSPFCILVHENG